MIAWLKAHESTAADRHGGHGATPGVALAMVLLLVSPLEAAEVPVECTVVYTLPGGFYVDAGRTDGLRKGDLGRALRHGVEIARVQVIEVAASTARLRLLSDDRQNPVRVDDRIEFLIDVETRKGGTDPSETERSPTLRRGEEEPPVPLLTPPEQRQRRLSEPRNMFHGRIWMREIVQLDSEKSADYSISRVGTSGSYERIGGTPWALEWNGDLSYRDGSALEDTRDYRDLVVHAYRLNLFRKWGDRSFVRGGRFLPPELPAVGHLDGVQGEKVINENLRLGGMVGFKPTPGRLDLSFREPTLVPYVTLETGTRGDFQYSGTAGLLGSLHEGKANRLALLLDQGAALAPRLTLFSTCEVDLDVGGAETRSGVHLTHLDVSASYRLWPGFELRGGVDHYELPDTRTEREFLPFEDDAFFDSGYWRSFLGAGQELPWNLRLDEEIGWVDPSGADGALHWRIGLTRRDLFAPGSSATLSVYNIEGSGSSGCAAQVHARFLLLRGQLSILPAFSYRTVDIERDSEDFDLGEFSLGVQWRISRQWGAHARFARVFGTETAANIFDLGITYRW